MRTEGFKRGLISVSLISALVFSMVLTATPVLAPAVIYEPGGTTIEVEPGQEFTLRFRLRWDIPGELGYFSFSIYWDCPENDPSENFTFENVAAYFDLDNDNLPDPGLDPIDIIVDRVEGAVGTGTRYVVVVHHDAGDPRDGEFNVDLMIRASGAGDVPHAPTNNHPIVISGTIDVPEGPTWYSYSPPNPYITIKVLAKVGVEVLISPGYQSGLPGSALDYTVIVKNIGGYDDNYDLTASDNAGWGPTLSDNLLEIPAGENMHTTLSLIIPENAAPCTEDNITVTANSQENAEVSDSASCIAHAAQVGLIPRAPIYIDGNDNFIPANGVVGGSGTENDPYIIENWDISAENAHGIEISNTTAHFVIRNCYIHDGKGFFNKGIHLKNVKNGKIDKVISDNNYDGIVLSNSNNNIIGNCTVGNNEIDGINLDYSSNNIIENCTIENNTMHGHVGGIHLSHSDNNLISNNILRNNGNGIYLSWYSDNNLISNNILEDHSSDGIRLSDRSNSNDIVGNNLTNISSQGISLGGSFYNNIVGNNITSLGSGISVSGSIGNILSGNNITSGWGISLVFGGEATLTGNIITNSERGIYLQYTGYNLISNNIVENCTEGIRLRNSTISGNLIYRNNFINNENQAYDNRSNQWDNGYPSGGNYWSDYTGEDNYQGENQDIPGSDGIGDTPYYIPGDNNQDRYPLMNPYLPAEVIVRGKITAHNIDQTGDPPWHEYEIGDRPLVMVAKEIGSGGVVAAGIVPTCRSSPTPGWKHPANPLQYLDILFDEAFRWMVPGAVNVLWYEGYNVYNTTDVCYELVEALENKGYTVTGDSTEPITSGLLSAYDILVLPQLQLGTPGTGGDPDLLPDADVQAIKSFVEGGGGLFIMDGSDFGGHHYSKVMNKVLESVGFDYFFQDDQVSDPTNNWNESDFRPIADVDPTTDIGSAYQVGTGTTEIGLYSICSLARGGPGVSLYVLPDYQVGMPGDTIEYTITVSNPENPLAENLTYNISADDNADWGLSLENNSLFVPIGEYRETTLSVTIPADMSLSNEDTILVTVTASGHPEVQTSFITVAHAGKRIEPTDDTYVSTHDNDANYSGENSLRVGRYYEYWQWPYLQFDLSEIPPGANITDARLYFYAYYKYAEGFDVLVHEVENDDWTENTITWNTKPTLGTVLDTKLVDYASRDSPKSYSWDVTSFVVNEFTGDNRVSFCLRPPDNLPHSLTRAFWSKEHYENRVHPFLRISYITEVPEVEEWDAFITATFSGGSDDAFFSVRPDATPGFDNAYDIPKPPPPVPPYVRTFFYYPGQTPDELHRSCLAPENLMEWPLRIEYADGVEDVTLTWGVENIPLEYSIHLYRGENLVADMKAEDNYTFEASTGSYDFRIVVGRLLPFTLELTRGWNMISFPVLLENSSPDSIFGSYYALYGWDAQNKHYVLHADSGSFIEPDPDVEAGVGYWAYVLENENVNLLGVPVGQLTLSLRQGWNLIGPPYGGSSIADPADDPDNSVLPWALTWNSSEKSYSMTQLLEAGKGYWVYALQDCTLTQIESGKGGGG